MSCTGKEEVPSELNPNAETRISCILAVRTGLSQSENPMPSNGSSICSSV